MHNRRNLLTATIGIAAVTALKAQAHLVRLRDDIDHTGDGIRTIGRRRAAGDDFDPLDKRGRNAVEAYTVRTVLVGYSAPAIDQHQGPVVPLVT